MIITRNNLNLIFFNPISISQLRRLNYSPVKTNILNEKNLSPVHLATELNKASALQLMGKYRDVIDIQQGGEHGRTALHLAAIYDHEECAKILVREELRHFYLITKHFNLSFR